jgi:hypothetical protein
LGDIGGEADRNFERSSPLLLPDRIEPYRLLGVYEKFVCGCRDEIVLDFGDNFLRFLVDPITDTIGSQFHGRQFVAKRGYRSVGSETPWKQYLRKKCGWTWLAVNQQGYWDTVLISFDVLVPNILLKAMSSSIYVFTVGPMEKIRAGKSAKPKSNKKSARKI